MFSDVENRSGSIHTNGGKTLWLAVEQVNVEMDSLG
jgi:hypothetical protein